MPRFFCDAPIRGETVELMGSELQHMTKVMRLSVGDEVTLFDDSGDEFVAHVDTIGRQSATLSIISRQTVDRELPFSLHMGVALPKGDRQQWLVEKLVELGVTTLTPLTTQRGVAQPNEKAMQRINRWIIAASKQSRRNRLMKVTVPCTISQFFESEYTEKLFAHPNGETHLGAIARTVATGGEYACAIGPEGGFTDDEVDAAIRGGAKVVSLGARILRIETAAISVASCFIFQELT